VRGCGSGELLRDLQRFQALRAPYGIHLLCELCFERRLPRRACLLVSGRSRRCKHEHAEDGGDGDPHDFSFGPTGAFL
jgi:hypothetical protein